MFAAQPQHCPLRLILPLATLALASVSLLACGQSVPQSIGSTSALQTRQEHTRTLYAAAKRLKAKLASQQVSYIASQSELRSTLQRASDHTFIGTSITEFGYERTALESFKQNAELLSVQARAIMAQIDKHRSVSRNYVVSLNEAPATYGQLAAQFRQFAKEESYSDRRDDYLVFASIFDNLATRFQRAPRQVQPDIEAMDELYPYLQRTEVMLTRFHDAVDLLPSDPSGGNGVAIEEQLKLFVQSFNTFRGAIRQLDQQLKEVSETERVEPPAASEHDPQVDRQRIVPAQLQPQITLASHRADPSHIRSTFIPVDPSSPTAMTSSPPTSSTGLAVESPAPRDVLKFRGADNGVQVFEVVGVDLKDGGVYSAQLPSGRSVAFRVRFSPTTSTPTLRRWLAERTIVSPTVAATLVAYRP